MDAYQVAKEAMKSGEDKIEMRGGLLRLSVDKNNQAKQCQSPEQILMFQDCIEGARR